MAITVVSPILVHGVYSINIFLNEYVDWTGLLVVTSEKTKFIKETAGALRNNCLKFGIFFFNWLTKYINTFGAEVLEMLIMAHGSMCRGLCGWCSAREK